MHRDIPQDRSGYLSIQTPEGTRELYAHIFGRDEDLVEIEYRPDRVHVVIPVAWSSDKSILRRELSELSRRMAEGFTDGTLRDRVSHEVAAAVMSAFRSAGTSRRLTRFTAQFRRDGVDHRVFEATLSADDRQQQIVRIDQESPMDAAPFDGDPNLVRELCGFDPDAVMRYWALVVPRQDDSGGHVVKRRIGNVHRFTDKVLGLGALSVDAGAHLHTVAAAQEWIRERMPWATVTTIDNAMDMTDQLVRDMLPAGGVLTAVVRSDPAQTDWNIVVQAASPGADPAAPDIAFTLSGRGHEPRDVRTGPHGGAVGWFQLDQQGTKETTLSYTAAPDPAAIAHDAVELVREGVVDGWPEERLQLARSVVEGMVELMPADSPGGRVALWRHGRTLHIELAAGSRKATAGVDRIVDRSGPGAGGLVDGAAHAQLEVPLDRLTDPATLNQVLGRLIPALGIGPDASAAAPAATISAVTDQANANGAKSLHLAAYQEGADSRLTADLLFDTDERIGIVMRSDDPDTVEVTVPVEPSAASAGVRNLLQAMAAGPVSGHIETPTFAVPLATPHSTERSTDRYPSLDELRHAEFRAAVAAMTTLSADSVVSALFVPHPQDEVTGFYEARVSPLPDKEVMRAMRHAEETGEPAFFVSAEIANLGDLNQTVENRAAAANSHYRELAAIFTAQLSRSGAVVVPMRRGETQIGAIVIGVQEPTIAAL